TFSARKVLWNKNAKISTFLKVETPPTTILESPSFAIQLSIGALQLTLPENIEPYWVGQLLKGFQYKVRNLNVAELALFYLKKLISPSLFS
ncbi:hypothetical protein L4C31_10155, partial [Aliivibrio sifiae]